MMYDNNKGGEKAKFIVQELKEPAGLIGPDFRKIYDSFAKRILWMDGSVCEDAFQMNTAWYFAAPEKDPIFETHVHPATELIGFFGSNPDDPYDLGGVIEFTVDGEAHRLTRTTMIYLPGNMPHNPVRILEVNRPIFHFSILTDTAYDDAAFYK